MHDYARCLSVPKSLWCYKSYIRVHSEKLVLRCKKCNAKSKLAYLTLSAQMSSFDSDKITQKTLPIPTPYHTPRHATPLNVLGAPFHISDSIVSVIQWSIPVEWQSYRSTGTPSGDSGWTQKACQCGDKAFVADRTPLAAARHLCLLFSARYELKVVILRLLVQPVQRFANGTSVASFGGDNLVTIMLGYEILQPVIGYVPRWLLLFQIPEWKWFT